MKGSGHVTDLRFGRYEALFRIGLGGMAEVYAARMRGEGGFQKLVAVKRMLPHLTGDQKFVDMFLDEARLAANIVSPHVTQVFDLGRAEDGSLYIVMELIVGVNLTHFLVFLHEQQRFVDVALGVELIAQAAQGLDDAHDARTPTGDALRLVHRDISPQNIMVGLDGRVRVTDFGIAQALHLRTTQTQAGEKKGKYSYFAPEQAFGRPVDRRTDVFALGVVAWELLLGRRLFPGSPVEALEAIRGKQIAVPHSLRAEIPEAVSDVLMRALAHEPDDRFATAAEFARALRDAARGSFATPTSREVGSFVLEAGGEWLAQLRHAISSADTKSVVLPEAIEAGPSTSAVWGALPAEAADAVLAAHAVGSDVETPSVAERAPDTDAPTPEWNGHALATQALAPNAGRDADATRNMPEIAELAARSMAADPPTAPATSPVAAAVGGLRAAPAAIAAGLVRGRTRAAELLDRVAAALVARDFADTKREARALAGVTAGAFAFAAMLTWIATGAEAAAGDDGRADAPTTHQGAATAPPSTEPAADEAHAGAVAEPVPTAPAADPTESETAGGTGADTPATPTGTPSNETTADARPAEATAPKRAPATTRPARAGRDTAAAKESRRAERRRKRRAAREEDGVTLPGVERW